MENNKTSQIDMNFIHGIYQKLGKNELILDVRTVEEYAEGHVPGSRNIPHELVGDRVEELKKFDKIYIYCRSGKRAQIATQVLLSQGLRNLACVANGGMMTWSEAGFPEES